MAATPFERVASDPGLRRVLEVARSWGVAPSVLLGRKVAVAHQYDATGRLVRSVPEPAWTDEDGELAVALAIYEAALCSGCSEPLADSTKAEHEERYVASVRALCHACVALDIARERASAQPHPNARLLGIELRKPEPEPEADDTLFTEMR